ncbi:MAG: hypothetical protein KME07_16150 [Pegethrix bostrychoides GSE-TBD4-15B]|jgi:hypothetical protein|uniref:Uncharacterized protein n=1 Tax=Pegethrix bostrychoides GSE-TBD4-15B TaxID=2839662 RepID=A0A951PCD1_9CYAN|nr:hypothetical protein [Pegethrix bostrychoides GSE-TBD4-15B]
MDINGSWLGTYWQNDSPTRFEATLVVGDGSLSGSILDDNLLGEARISGEVVGRSIQFTKRYLTSSPTPIDYSGTISEDGNSMSGNWRIGQKYSGQWEAHRSNQDLMAELRNRIAQKVPAGVGQ